MSDYLATIFLAVVSFGLIAGILLAMADTRLYPLALGITVIALFYVLMQHPGAATSVSDIIHGAVIKVGHGNAQPVSTSN